MMSDVYKMTYLADHPEHVETIANWYWQEWDRHEGWDIERSRQFAVKGMHKDHLDINMIAVNNSGECVGTIEIREKWGLTGEDGEELNRYSPWLGSLYVSPDCRGGKLGFELCKFIKSVAKAVGIKECFAATSHLDNFFKNMGGMVVEETVFANEQMRIYKFEI